MHRALLQEMEVELGRELLGRKIEARSLVDLTRMAMKRQQQEEEMK